MAPSASHGKISTLAASAHLLKAVMGAGSFALPWAFLQAGVVLGPVLMVSVCVLSAYTHILLVRCRREASSRAGAHRLSCRVYPCSACFFVPCRGASLHVRRMRVWTYMRATGAPTILQATASWSSATAVAVRQAWNGRAEPRS